MTADLVAFLRACFDEEAKGIAERGTDAVAHTRECCYEGGYEGTTRCDCGAVAFRLADIESKRRIVERCAYLWEYGNGAGMDWILMQMAQPYADRPGFDPAWRTT